MRKHKILNRFNQKYALYAYCLIHVLSVSQAADHDQMSSFAASEASMRPPSETFPTIFLQYLVCNNKKKVIKNLRLVSHALKKQIDKTCSIQLSKNKRDNILNVKAIDAICKLYPQFNPKEFAKRKDYLFPECMAPRLLDHLLELSGVNQLELLVAQIAFDKWHIHHTEWLIPMLHWSIVYNRTPLTYKFRSTFENLAIQQLGYYDHIANPRTHTLREIFQAEAQKQTLSNNHKNPDNEKLIERLIFLMRTYIEKKAPLLSSNCASGSITLFLLETLHLFEHIIQQGHLTVLLNSCHRACVKGLHYALQNYKYSPNDITTALTIAATEKSIEHVEIMRILLEQNFSFTQKDLKTLLRTFCSVHSYSQKCSVPLMAMAFRLACAEGLGAFIYLLNKLKEGLNFKIAKNSQGLSLACLEGQAQLLPFLLSQFIFNNPPHQIGDLKLIEEVFLCTCLSAHLATMEVIFSQPLLNVAIRQCDQNTLTFGLALIYSQNPSYSEKMNTWFAPRENLPTPHFDPRFLRQIPRLAIDELQKEIRTDLLFETEREPDALTQAPMIAIKRTPHKSFSRVFSISQPSLLSPESLSQVSDGSTEPEKPFNDAVLGVPSDPDMKTLLKGSSSNPSF
jgi:hypothetical protein